MKAIVQRLRAEIASDRRALEGRLRELRSLELSQEAPDSGTLAVAAVALHHAYSAVEAILQRTARFVEGELPDGADWHRQLLEDMALDIEGVRPAVLGEDTLHHLRKLLAFRHFFRHAYAVALDPAELRLLQEHARAVEPHLERDFDVLDAFLSDLAGAAD